MSSTGRERVRNRLLAALPPASLAALARELELIDLPHGFVLVEADRPTEHIYFIEAGLASVVALGADSECVEVRHLGREGLSGTHLLLGVDRTPCRTFMQVAGSAFRFPAARLEAALAADVALRQLLLRYVYVSEIQLAHSVLAQARYPLHARLARWLLMCHDRADAADLPLTHEFLALMLGVRRSGVTIGLQNIEGMGIIKATRGNVRILDRHRLEGVAGESYGLPEREDLRLFGAVA